jgi:hypothetical protein
MEFFTVYPPVYMNSQNQIRLHKIRWRGENFYLFVWFCAIGSDFGCSCKRGVKQCNNCETFFYEKQNKLFLDMIISVRITSDSQIGIPNQTCKQGLKALLWCKKVSSNNNKNINEVYLPWFLEQFNNKLSIFNVARPKEPRKVVSMTGAFNDVTTLFSLFFLNGPKKQECLFLSGFSSLF